MNDLNTNVKLFWDDRHKKEAISSICGFFENKKYYTTFEKTIDFLKLKEHVKPNLNVLEIGVGLGIVTKGFNDNGLFVSGLDISEVALKKVSKYCKETYTTNDLDKLPSDYFDIIICNRVVQHIPTNLLIVELMHCLRSLKIGGIFALQFVSNNKMEDMGVNATMLNIKAGTCCRTPKYLEKIINELGGKCKLVFSAKEVSGDVHECHVFHITKQ
jgi:2-polyprenyl-3-methyl-5-hydroxy-6-metoxy-1,4-benzoquinol methylase